MAELLNDSDWFAPWSAAKTFEMMGPKAKAALPALEERFNDPAEDLDLRYNYHSPCMENKVGSDIVTARYGARRWEYDFSKNTVTEFKE